MNELIEVGRYVRDLRASIERLFENALDWEHLPHLHDSSFASIDVVDHGSAGWRAEASLADGRPVTLDLRLSDDGWVTQTKTGDRLMSEIRSSAEATDPGRCRVTVTFHVADIADERRQAVGSYYERLYATLYDEDERMMMARAEAISRGPRALQLRRQVSLPDGSVHEVPLYCPHQGLPLDAEPDANNILTCPWHGYRFDVRTGRCVSGQTAGWTRR